MSNSIYTAAVILLVAGLVHYVITPIVRTELARRRAREHLPQPEEIWLQEGQLLYIDNVGPNGVSIIYFDGSKINQWTDTWPEWQERLRVRTVTFTGQKRPLGPH